MPDCKGIDKMLYNDDEQLLSLWIDNDYDIYNHCQTLAKSNLYQGSAKEVTDNFADFLERRATKNLHPFSNITDDIDYSNVDFSKIAYDILEELE